MPSSVIKYFSYQPESKLLTITFVTGLVYQYTNVPERTFKLFKAATSKGRYFNYHIKEKFKFQKLEDC
ncbi:KTSC domain-containing protein [Pedobacter petrophilus]|uniref:KTSC domain-containing protein n=1 Tax=Pedobacter petrophilus TaxID=1908241 RepID=A0A7K0FWV0_9SPHI|nr:KTSC domain-containing protein [Pedobacter petrophilus]MRX75995.1 KTSC domain-containing protein [Pedobacter petrophilus]